MQLDAEAARAAVARTGAEVGLGIERTAQAILAIAGERMADAIREITINDGVDPREATIVPGGDAAEMRVIRAVLRRAPERWSRGGRRSPLAGYCSGPLAGPQLAIGGIRFVLIVRITCLRNRSAAGSSARSAGQVR